MHVNLRLQAMKEVEELSEFKELQYSMKHSSEFQPNLSPPPPLLCLSLQLDFGWDGLCS